MRAVYLDLDGTLLGRGASLLHDGDGAVSLAGVRAVEACLRAGVEVVLISGRRRAQVAEDARLFGSTAYVFEAGACLVLDGEEVWLAGAHLPGELTIAQQIAASGAPALLLERHPGRLEYHEPWHTEREVSHLFRGLVDARAVDDLLRAEGFGDLRLIDNGAVTRRSAALDALPHVRGYHLVPAGVAKVNAVAAHMRARGLEASDTLAVGDSREDLACAAVVGEMWLVGNALRADPGLADGAPANVRIAAGEHGAGVYEAVVSALMQRR